MVKSVLLVKMSSLGDVVHTFAAVEDFKKKNPRARLTWAVEEAYLPLVALHPAVNEIIPVPLRRLRKNARGWFFSRPWWAFLHTFAQPKYEIVIDAQGLLKSAFLTAKASAERRAGFDWHSAREPLASLFYQQRFAVAKNQHAVWRTRQLFAETFQYSVPENLDFGLRPRPIGAHSAPYLLFFHGTTWQSKTLPVGIWQELKKQALAAGYQIYLPWGNEEEKRRAAEICGDSKNCQLLPPLGLAELSEWIAGSAGAISVDTGLGHLAAAFGLPVVGVFGATSPAKSGILGQKSHNLGGENPCYKKDCRAHGAATANACTSQFSAADIWQQWQKLAL